ncbi:phosphoribosyltransferase [Streptomyces sp. NPDC048106]|uniref:phosphoribosyltransferase n=1 Tax=Streptomyces sp. NPDC048106 TaxID=3155750 RepID=UPI003455D29D
MPGANSARSTTGNELRFLAEHVLLPRPDITAVLTPLYGSLPLALTARGVLPALLVRPIDVHLARLVFDDQRHVAYLGAGGTVRHRATAPRVYRDRLSADARDATVLVIDDNVGHSSTLRAARSLIERLGGRALTPQRRIGLSPLPPLRSARHRRRRRPAEPAPQPASDPMSVPCR